MKHKLLFVDDEKNILLAIRRHFRQKYEIYLASSGIEALELLEKEEPIDVLITDYFMPMMNGITLIKKTNESFPNTKCILLSGNTEILNTIEDNESIIYFKSLSKPCSSFELENNIQLALSQ